MSSFPFVKRSYWICVLGILTYGFYNASIELLDAYQNRAIAFTVDSLYLNWNTSFPAVTVCEIYNGEKNFDINEKNFGEDRDKKLDDLFSSIAFFSGNCYSCKLCESVNCPQNLTSLLLMFRSNCDTMIKNCFFNKEPFPCCEGFLPLETEFGICFSINSAFTNPVYGKRLIANREFGPGILEFDVYEDVQLHYHSSIDIPYFNENKYCRDTLLWGHNAEIILGITEVFNDIDVKDVLQSQRRCKFTWENYDKSEEIVLFNSYSHSICAVKCHSDIQMKFCNCTHQLMPRNKRGTDVLCDYNGLMCLTKNYNLITEERMKCECMISCEDPEIFKIYGSTTDYRDEDEAGSGIKIYMMDLPRARYVRKVIRSKLDLIISVGGIAGLYYGASILSIIELSWSTIKNINANLRKIFRKIIK